MSYSSSSSHDSCRLKLPTVPRTFMQHTIEPKRIPPYNPVVFYRIFFASSLHSSFLGCFPHCWPRLTCTQTIVPFLRSSGHMFLLVPCVFLVQFSCARQTFPTIQASRLLPATEILSTSSSRFWKLPSHSPAIFALAVLKIQYPRVPMHSSKRRLSPATNTARLAF